MGLDLPEDPLAALDWDWSEYEPRFARLAAAELDPAGVAAWLADWSALSDLLSESAARFRLAVDLHSEDEAARARLYAFLEKVVEPAEAASQVLKEKLLASALEPELFSVPLRNIRAQAALFRKENLSLRTEEEKLGLEYSRIAGEQTVAWEGEELTLAALVDELKGAGREARERGWRLGMSRTLADKPELGRLWAKLLGLRLELAANSGKRDYREYAWQERLRFDYSSADCLAFHDAIEEVVVPAARRVRERHARLLGVDRLRPWDMSVDVMRQSDINVDPMGDRPLRPYAEIAELESRAGAVFSRIDPRLGSYFEAMRREGLYDLANYKGKAPGAYQTDFPASRRPFVLMNASGGSGDVDTLFHEMGHAFHSWQMFGSRRLPYAQQRELPMEFAEVASMSMELLASAYLERDEGGFYSAEEAARARILHLEELLLFWPYMAVVDGFQHWAYSDPEAAGSPSRCDSAWSALWDRFVQGEDWSGLEEAKASGWQRKLHIFQLPFYYVEYGIAQLGAVQIWRNSMRDRKAAVDSYLEALALGYSEGLPALFATAGAKFAFDAATVRDAVALIEAEIEKQSERIS